MWVEVYSGTDLLYNDRDLTLYTTYIYRLTVHNDFGFISSDNSTQVVTHGGQPFEAPALTVTTVSHTKLKADWIIPGMRANKQAVAPPYVPRQGYYC